MESSALRTVWKFDCATLSGEHVEGGHCDRNYGVLVMMDVASHKIVAAAIIELPLRAGDADVGIKRIWRACGPRLAATDPYAVETDCGINTTKYARHFLMALEMADVRIVVRPPYQPSSGAPIERLMCQVLSELVERGFRGWNALEGDA